MDAQWLKTQFDLHPEKSKAQLAAALKIGAPAVSKMLAGTRQIKAQEYLGMRKFFGLPVDGGKALRGGSKHYVLAPLESGMKEQGSPADENAWMIPASLLQGRTKAPPEKIRIFAVQENAMAPDFLSGEHVVVDLSDVSPSPSGVFLVSDGIGHIIRQCEYVPHSKPASVRLSALNARYETHTLPLSKAGLMGRVIAKLQWV